MKVTWSEEAVAELYRRFGNDAADWKLAYDTEGCGCAVNGVPALWAVNGAQDDDLAADSAPIRLWHDPKQAVFFDDELKVTYRSDKGSFTLASDGQIYTTRLVLADHRKKAPAKAGNA